MTKLSWVPVTHKVTWGMERRDTLILPIEKPKSRGRHSLVRSVLAAGSRHGSVNRL